jgi:chaperone required for assembly of F1-ATPase
MKRFYTQVGIGIPKRGSYSILLDGKPVKTPKRADLVLPWRELAEAIAEEWRAQGEEIKPAEMFLTKCANTAIDQTAGHEEVVVEDILAYANDLLCYRAIEPADLVARQSENWDPLLAWLEARFGVKLGIGTGIAHIEHEEAALAKLRAAIGVHNAFTLTALYAATALCGSLVLALALLEGRLTAEEAFAASRLDEEYQAEKWGRDAGAELRARALAAELDAAARFMRCAQRQVETPPPGKQP